MVHVKHYSAGVRKGENVVWDHGDVPLSGLRLDGLTGMRELFTAHPDLVAPRLTALIGCTVKVIGDEVRAVRIGRETHFDTASAGLWGTENVGAIVRPNIPSCAAGTHRAEYLHLSQIDVSMLVANPAAPRKTTSSPHNFSPFPHLR